MGEWGGESILPLANGRTGTPIELSFFHIASHV
jgi:hypothetical protein